MADRLLMGVVIFLLGWQTGVLLESREQPSTISAEQVEARAREVFCQSIVEAGLVRSCTILESQEPSE